MIMRPNVAWIWEKIQNWKKSGCKGHYIWIRMMGSWVGYSNVSDVREWISLALHTKALGGRNLMSAVSLNSSCPKIYVCVYIYTNTHIHTYIYIHTYVYAHINTHIHTHMYMHIHMHIHTYIYIYTHTHIYLHTHLCICTYIHTHIYEKIHTWTEMILYIRKDTEIILEGEDIKQMRQNAHN